MFAYSISRVKEGKTQAMCRLGFYVVRWNAHALGAIVALLTMIAAAAWAADGETPGVLILHSNQRPTPAAVVIEDTLRTKIPGELQRPVELYSEYLDSEWSSIMAYGAEQAEFLQHKYGGRNVRLIVTSAPPALQFATRFRDRLFDGAPIVHIAMPKDLLDRTSLPADVVGKTVDLDPTRTLELAQRLFPDTKRVVVIVGATERDRVWEERIRAALSHMEGAPEEEYLAGLRTADLLRRVAALPRGTIIYTPGYFTDGTGQTVTPRHSVELIAGASAVPVFGALDTFVGTGIVGGYVTRYEEQAAEAAAIATRLLNGTDPREIAPASVEQVPIVDWRQIRRWGIDERQLPQSTIVMFREPTIWDKYRRVISIAIAILVLQAALIAALLFERRSRLRTANALEESQKQINLAASAARLSLWIWDTARNKLRATGQLRQRFDSLREDPTAFDDVVNSAHPGDRERLERTVASALKTGEEFDIEYRVLDAGGDVRWVAVRGRAEKNGSERLLGVTLDVTERKAAELRAAQDRTALRHMTRVSMVGQLSAAIAHQLNQPLAAILGNAEAAQKMLERDNVDLAELREICDDIVTEDRRATDVIRRLSELYKRGDMKVQTIDLNKLVRETLDLLRTELLIRHVTPVTKFAPSLPAIEGGYVQLQQVVLNLVLNAVDAMSEVKPAQRNLTLTTESSDSDVSLCVVDNGTGIAPGHVKTVFDPFWSTKSGGMGMGLAICRSIVMAHSGSITVANNVERGATFCMTLPIAKPDKI